MKTSEIRSFEELAAIAAELSAERWIFRGVESSEYTLIPKIGRKGTGKRQFDNTPRKLTQEDERRLYRTFRRQARPFIHFEVARDIDWLAIGQHHGLPTRLLDWTESIFVAAYFATLSTVDGTCATIYGIKDLEVFPMDLSDPFAAHGVTAFYPTPFSPRITAQRSVFTVHSNPSERFDPRGLHQWACAGNGEHARRHLAYKIKLTLDSIGFNSASMMPDLDGLASHLGWAFKRERLPP